MPRKKTSFFFAASARRNRPLPLPISISTGPAPPNSSLQSSAASPGGRRVPGSRRAAGSRGVADFGSRPAAGWRPSDGSRPAPVGPSRPPAVMPATRAGPVSERRPEEDAVALAVLVERVVPILPLEPERDGAGVAIERAELRLQTGEVRVRRVARIALVPDQPVRVAQRVAPAPSGVR